MVAVPGDVVVTCSLEVLLGVLRGFEGFLSSLFFLRVLEVLMISLIRL